jgi:uncharacterized membrane protein YeaQ/YmgE (transglycosylase-associated protein family)
MHIILFILFGFIVGLIARAIMPGRQPMSILITTLLGIGGSFLGGAVTSLIVHRPLLQLREAGWIGSIVGALVLLAIAHAVNARRHVPV